MIGGKAPSKYVEQIQGHSQVQLSNEGLDDILRTHLIEPSLLRSDAFDDFYKARKGALLRMIEDVMGKTAVASVELPPEDDDSGDENDEL